MDLNCWCHSSYYSGRCCKAINHECICLNMGSYHQCKSVEHDCTCTKYNSRFYADCKSSEKHNCICHKVPSKCRSKLDHQCGCIKTMKYCKATKDHFCTCDKNGSACKADGDNHDCICKIDRDSCSALLH